jgi:hypothetical protein
MIPQLVQRLIAAGMPPGNAAAAVLQADPLDLVLHIEEVWDAANLWQLAPLVPPTARQTLFTTGWFNQVPPAAGTVAWDHAGYALVLESSRVVQIMRRVVREYRSGERLGTPSVATQRWLDATEALVFGAAFPFSAWLSTSGVRPDAESVRRNLYWRLFGMPLGFGTDEDREATFEKSETANLSFRDLFEELLFELWKAIENVRNSSGPNASDDDRIFRLSEQLAYILRSRRQLALLGREELAAVTALGWFEVTLSVNSPVVQDLRAEATSAADRLKVIGERVKMPAHPRSAAFFSMAAELSLLLRTLEAGFVSAPQFSWLLYLTQQQAINAGFIAVGGAAPLGNEVRRVITEWQAATGKNLKQMPRALEVRALAQTERRTP